MEYQIADRVLSHSKHSLEREGTVWKISDEAVHVCFIKGNEELYEKFYFKTNHHMQTPIHELELIERPNL